MDMPEPSADKRRMRRVPVELRKRAARSCDLCKFRRRKCVPLSGSANCVGCTEHNLTCSFTAPRKPRFYGSLDDLSDRYRCLDALVKGVFPDHPVSSIHDLVSLGHRMSVDMPEISAPARTRIGVESLVRSPETHVTEIRDASCSSTMEPNVSTEASATADRVTSRPDSQGLQNLGPTIFRDPAGKKHYIGPSGTLNLLDRLRQVFLAYRSAHIERLGRPLAVSTILAESPETLEPVTPDSSSCRNGIQGTGTPESAPDVLGQRFSSIPCEADFEECLTKLPPPDVLEFLVHSYFRNVHGSLPLFIRPALEHELETYVARPRRRRSLGKGQRLPDWGWLGCLYMILVFGSMSSPSLGTIDHVSFQKQYVTATRNLLPQLVTSCSMTNIQALLLLAFYLQSNCERNAAWNLTGVAVRTSFAIGLHRRPIPGSESPAPREGETLVLHTLYGFELFLAASLGRPSSIRDVDIEVVVSRWSGTSITSVDQKSSALSLQLHMILAQANLQGEGHALEHLYSWKHNLSSQNPSLDIPVIRSSGSTGSLVPQDGAALVDFDELEQSLACRTRPDIRASLTLAMQYHYAGLCISRDALLRDIEQLWTSHTGIYPQAAPLCVAGIFHAHQLILCFMLLNNLQMVNGVSSLDVWYGYWAGMLLNLCCLPRHTGGSPITLLGDGVGLAKHLVAEVHGIVQKVEKCATMKRLASVMKAFVDLANDTDTTAESVEPQRVNTVARRETVRPALALPEAHSHSGGQQMDWIVDPWFPSIFAGLDELGDEIPNPFVGLTDASADASSRVIWTDVEAWLGRDAQSDLR